MSSRKFMLYVLAKPRYFAEGSRGHVTHALGVIDGFIDNGWEVTALSGVFSVTDHGDKSGDRRTAKFVAVTPEPAGFLGEFWWRLKLLRQASNLLRAPVDAITFRYAVKQPLLALLLARLAKIRGSTSVLEVNSLAYHTFKTWPAWIRKIMLCAECLVVSRFDIVYTVSEQLARDLQRGGVDSHKLIAVPNGASTLNDSDVFIEMARREGVTSSNIRFVYAGVFQRYYDFRMLVEVAADVLSKWDSELVFYGDGPVFDETKALAAGNERIVFHGRYKRNDLPGMLNPRTDIFLLPYADSATANIGSPIKLFEYMSMGIPIVASSVGQVANIIKNEVTGYLYSPDSKTSLASALDMARLDLQRTEKAATALRIFRNECTWEKRMSTLAARILEYR